MKISNLFLSSLASVSAATKAEKKVWPALSSFDTSYSLSSNL